MNTIIKKIYINIKKNKKKQINITYGVDKNFLLGVAISINSILIYNSTNINLIFHLFIENIDEQYLQHFKSIMKIYNSSIIIYIIDAKQVKQLPTTKFWSYATYFRLIAFEYLSKIINYVLYLDGDVICKGDIKKIFNINLTNFFSAVVLDIDDMQKNSSLRLNLPYLNGKYFNAGVIYVNLILWLKFNLTQKSFEMLNNNNVFMFKYLDQDVLNILFQTKNIYLSPNYNYLCTLNNKYIQFSSSNNKTIIKNSVVFIHYTGITKPWHTWGINYYPSLFFLYSYINSPWNSFPLKTAITTRELKEQYKYSFTQHNYVYGLFIFLKYIFKSIYLKFKKNDIH